MSLASGPAGLCLLKIPHLLTPPMSLLHYLLYAGGGLLFFSEGDYILFVSLLKYNLYAIKFILLRYMFLSV